MTAALLAGAAFAIALGLSRLLSQPGRALRVLDYPGGRSLHEQPMPRTGGLAIAVALAVCWPLALAGSPPLPGFWALAGGAVLVGAISLWDDLRSLPAPARLLVHVGAAGLLLAAGLAPERLEVPGLGTLPLGVAGYPFALLFVVWFTNLYNFMDGMDGFAGGMACIGFLLLALLGWREGRETFALLATIVAFAHLGFLVLNFPPARIFLGDAGSIPAGFLAAGFSLWGVREAVFPLWVPVLAFSPFIVDATVTVLRRLWRRERVWEAHRSHYYQRLVLAGWSHRRTVLAEYGLMLAASGSAAGFAFLPDRRWAGLGIAGWIMVYFALVIFVRRVELRRDSRT